MKIDPRMIMAVLHVLAKAKRVSRVMPPERAGTSWAFALRALRRGVA